MKQMRQTILMTIALAAVVMAAITCHAGPNKDTAPTPSKPVLLKNMGKSCFEPCEKVSRHLGNTATDIIFNPSKVTVYRLAGRDTIAAGEVEVDKNFVRVAKVGTLSKDYTKLVQYLLINDTANYAVDSIKVRSPYQPECELVFERKNVAVSVLVSRIDFSWVLISDGKKQFVYNYADKRAIDRLFDNLLK